MIKFIIILGLAYLAYRTLKSMILPGPLPREEVDRQPMGRIDDVMVKDPYCESYFPRRSGVHLRREDEDLYFCSKECRDRFVAGQE